MKTNINKIFRIAVTLILCLVLSFCKEPIKVEPTEQLSLKKEVSSFFRNPSPGQLGLIPAATVQMKQFPELLKLKSGGVSSLMPATFEITLRSGQSVNETKTATVTSAPPKGDVLFMMDLTGSMWEELANTKANSVNIMNYVSSVIPDAQFGVISHMDYPSTYSSCGYSDTYGGGSDYPYMLNQSITPAKANVAAALNALTIGDGWDYPESYARVLYETASDGSIGWRDGARKFVVAWLDAPPHDCLISTGTDPGRDGVVGTGDDLNMASVLAAMFAKNITLIVLNSQDLDAVIQTYWEGYAQKTTGKAFQINGNGTIPGGINIDKYITDKILEQTGSIDELKLEVCTPGFKSWLTGTTPVSYKDIILTATYIKDFTATFKVPDGTPDGLYEFDVCLVGDGATYGTQHVKIHVVNTIPVPFDIKPTSCPNPFNRGDVGVLPVAILGFTGFNVANIDPATVKLEGISPIRWALEDVAAPYLPLTNKALNKMSCNTSGPDGLADLTLKFDNLAITKFLASYKKNDVVKLHITGNLKTTGTPIAGEDIIVIIK